MKQVFAKVISNEQILPGITRPDGRTILSVKCMRLNCSEIAQEAKPGQFVMVQCEGECILPRPLSIHQVSDDGIAVFFNVWKDGRGTGWLSQCRKGDSVELFGPLGNGFDVSPNSHNLLLVAGGIGIAALRFLADEAIKQGHSVTLLRGTPTTHRYPENLLPQGIELVSTTEDGTVGHRGKVTDLLPQYIDRADQIFACGPMSMYRDMAHKKKELKLEGKPVQISLEMRMGCGRGVCYACTVRTKNGLKQVCQDGPVFNLDDIIWDEFAQA